MHLTVRRSRESQLRVVFQDIFSDLLLPMKELASINSFSCTEFGLRQPAGCSFLNYSGPLLHPDAHYSFIQLKTPPQEYGFLLIHSTLESDSIIDTDCLTVNHIYPGFATESPSNCVEKHALAQYFGNPGSHQSGLIIQNKNNIECHSILLQHKILHRFQTTSPAKFLLPIIPRKDSSVVYPSIYLCASNTNFLP